MKLTFSPLVKLALSVLCCFSAAVIGGLSTASSVETWYPTLIKPSFNPPDWIFGPVWTILYSLMAISLYWVWIEEKGYKRDKAMGFFFIQLILNVLWSFLFFGIHWLGIALIEIVLLWIAIFATILTFYRISPKSAYFLMPYLFWVSFATVLNAAIWILNS